MALLTIVWEELYAKLADVLQPAITNADPTTSVVFKDRISASFDERFTLDKSLSHGKPVSCSFVRHLFQKIAC